MALTTVTHTTPSVELLTRPNVFKRFLRETKAGFYGTATATGGTTGELIDTTRLKSGIMRREEVEGGFVRIPTTTDAAAPVGEIRPIVDYDATTGIITVEPPFSAAPDSGDTYEVWRLMHPQDAIDHLDNIITNEYYLPTWSMLSEVPDFDMEQNNTTDWNTTSNATAAKVTSQPAMNGKRWLRVTNSSANGYVATTNSIKVDPGQSYSLAALCRPTAAAYDAALILYDVTNSVTLDTLSYSGEATIRLWKSIYVGSTTNAVSIRLSGTNVANVCDWDDVVFYRDGERDIALPWWVRNKAQFKAAFRLVPASITASSLNVYSPEMRGSLDPAWDVQDSAFGSGQARLFSRTTSLVSPLFFFGLRNEEAYSSDTESKHLDANYVNEGLLFHYYDALDGTPLGSTVNAKWVATQLAKHELRWRRERYKQTERVGQILKSPDPGAFYSRNPQALNGYYR